MTTEVNGIILHYVKEGKGSPLILLHGNGEDCHIFDALTNRLKQNYTVYAIDSRNHGESSQTTDYSYETMATDIFEFIIKEKIESPSILGFSDGAILALLLAMNHNVDFHRMILLGINLKPTDFKAEIYQSVVDEFAKTRDPLMKMMLEEPNIELSELKKVRTKTLVVRAEDELFEHELYDNMVKTMPNAQLKIMQGHDHGSYIINQDILYSELKFFIDC